MTQEFVIHLAKNMLVTTMLVSAPMLVVGLVVGLVIGIFQAVTQIHEMTLTFIPKILAVTVAMILFLPWMMNLMLSYTQEIFQMIITLSK
jgi:flagellar biosynthesis protein FliQ